MIKILRYTEYIYLAVAIFAALEIYNSWGNDQNRVYLFSFFLVVSIGMFLFRRKYRKKFESRNKSKQH